MACQRRIDALRFALTKPKLSLFSVGDSASLSVTSTLSLVDRSWAEEKSLADPYLHMRLSEQEAALVKATKSIESVKMLVLSRLESGNKMTFLIAYTQLKNAEAERDHIMGIIGQLEYLRREVESADEPFDWKAECGVILHREPIRFSVKDEGDIALEELKGQVRKYCQMLTCE